MAVLCIIVELNRLDTADDDPVLDHVERLAIEQALVACNGNITKTAKSLGIYRATLQRKIKRHHITERTKRR